MQIWVFENKLFDCTRLEPTNNAVQPHTIIQMTDNLPHSSLLTKLLDSSGKYAWLAYMLSISSEWDGTHIVEDVAKNLCKKADIN